MEEKIEQNNINTTNTKTEKPGLTCFIIGCIIGAIAIIGSIVVAYFFFAVTAQIKAGQGIAAIVTIIIFPAFLICIALDIVSIILLIIGLKWKKLPSILATSLVVITMIVLIISWFVFRTVS